MKKKTPTEVMDEVDKLIEEGLDIEGLKKARRRLYRLDDDELSIDEWCRKWKTIRCIQEFIEG